MNKKILIFLTLLSLNSFAASVTVESFELPVLVNTKKYELDVSIVMACRYEKFVISDSSEYEYTYKEVPLTTSSKKQSDQLSLVTIINKENRTHKVSGLFKSNKGCQTYLNFFLVDKKYSLGWASQFHRPIRLGLLEHSVVKSDSIFNVAALADLFAYKKLSFTYRATHSNNVNVIFSLDDEPLRRMSSTFRTSVLKNELTGMPHIIKK